MRGKPLVIPIKSLNKEIDLTPDSINTPITLDDGTVCVPSMFVRLLAAPTIHVDQPEPFLNYCSLKVLDFSSQLIA